MNFVDGNGQLGVSEDQLEVKYGLLRLLIFNLLEKSRFNLVFLNVGVVPYSKKYLVNFIKKIMSEHLFWPFLNESINY